MTADLQNSPVFICGHPKSGTSLFRSILDSHPQLIVYPEETVFFRRFLPKAQGQPLEKQLELADEFLIQIFTWNRENPPPSQEGFLDRDYSAISFEDIRQTMRLRIKEQYRDERDILSAAILAFGQVTGQLTDSNRRWVEKSPYNEFFAEQIFKWWPDSRCIHVVRDPRDNYVSYHQKHASWSPEFFAANWRRSVRAGQENQAKFGVNRYWIVRYEDLVQSPEEITRLTMEFLQIDWDPSLAAPTRAGENWQGNSMFSNQFQEISAAPVGRWMSKLSIIDAAVIQKFCQNEMKLLKYPLTEPEPSWAQKVAASSRVSTWPLRQRIRRVFNK